MNPFDSLRIRAGDASDFARVRKDWRLSFARSDFARWLTPRADWEKRASEIYWDLQTEIVDALLDGGADLWIACWAEAPTSIVGWAVMRTDIVHYVDVLPTYRKHGVARRLLAPALELPRVTYTHRTPLCRHLPIPAGWTYDPRPALYVPRRQQEAA